jgi:TRAP-type C4-dicarboxylate transport system permease small subunit
MRSNSSASRWAGVAVAYFFFSTIMLIGPVYGWLGNRVAPRVLGLPFSLVYVLLIITANFLALALLYRSRAIDHAELDEGDDSAATGGPIAP